MLPLLKRILKVSTYGLFVAATFAIGLMSGGGRDHKIFGEFSLPTIDTAHADVPPVGSDAGCAGCAGSGDGSGGGEGSGEGSGDGGGTGDGSGGSGGGADGSGADGGGGADGSGGDGDGGG